MGFIYKITNKINGKVYIGQTITPNKTSSIYAYRQWLGLTVYIRTIGVQLPVAPPFN